MKLLQKLVNSIDRWKWRFIKFLIDGIGLVTCDFEANTCKNLVEKTFCNFKKKL
jgi:hypothetical protein